jgi:hypothetical protein
MSDVNQAAVDAANAVMAAHIAGLNARDNDAIAASLHFPHYRLASGRMQVWETKESYLDDFYARAGDGWARSQWDSLDVLSAAADKVHLDVRFTRFNDEGAAMGQFRSLWVITRECGRWAAKLRSSFAA